MTRGCAPLMRVIHRRALALPLVAALALAAGACSSDGEKVADQVAKQVAKELSIGKGDVQASCPSSAKAENGQAFTCDLVVDGQKVVGSIQFVSDSQFTLGFNGRLFPKADLIAQVEADIQTKQNSPVTELDCGGGTTFTFIPYDSTIECHGTSADGQAGTAVVSVQQDGQPHLETMTADAAA